MRNLLVANLDHLLFALLVISRGAHILTTYLITPRLTLETNPLIRRFGWRMTVFSVVVCFVPYYNVTLGLLILVPSLFVAAGNSLQVWSSRAVGEEERKSRLLELTTKTKLSHAILSTWSSALFVGLAGLLLMLLSPDPRAAWGYWFGMGLLVYALVVAIFRTLFFISLFKEGSSHVEAGAAEEV